MPDKNFKTYDSLLTPAVRFDSEFLIQNFLKHFHFCGSLGLLNLKSKSKPSSESELIFVNEQIGAPESARTSDEIQTSL